MSSLLIQLVSEEYSYLSCQSSHTHSSHTQTDQEVQVDLDSNAQDLLPDEYFKMKLTREFAEHNVKFGLQYTSLGKYSGLHIF